MNTPEPREIEHSILCCSDNTYCAHPRNVGLWRFPGDEIVVGHCHAECNYDEETEYHHTRCVAYKQRFKVLLQRSLDGGATWPLEHNRTIWDEGTSSDEKRAVLYPENAARDEFDMSHPDAAFFFGKTSLDALERVGPAKTDAEAAPLATYVQRSADRLRTWERVPFVITPPDGLNWVNVHRTVVRMPDGSFVVSAVAGKRVGIGMTQGQVALYGTDDDGMTWHHVSYIAGDPTGLGRPTYPSLALLASGRLLCVMLSLEGMGHFMCVSHSDDSGFTWSNPRCIVRLGQSPWVAHRERGKYGSVAEGRMQGQYGGQPMMYRSPDVMRLADGRIVVLFTRRRQPTGLGVILSEDDGATWSREQILLKNCVGSDLGYTQATQLEDGRIFMAYYLTREDGVHYIAGTHFRI